MQDFAQRIRISVLVTPIMLAAVGCAEVEREPAPAVTSFAGEAQFSPPIEVVAPVVQPKTKLAKKPTKGIKARNGVTRLAYKPDGVYTIRVSPDYVTSIYLEPGEILPGTVAIGNPDKTKWLVETTMQGSAEGVIPVIQVNAGAPDLKTNVTFNTNRRRYALDVASTTERGMDIVEIIYPPREENVTNSGAVLSGMWLELP